MNGQISIHPMMEKMKAAKKYTCHVSFSSQCGQIM